MAKDPVMDLRERQLKDVLAKQRAGKSLSLRERALMEEEAMRSTAFARTKVELADRLGVSRRTLTNYQAKDGAPRPRSDGRLDIGAWARFLQEQGVIAGLPEEAVDYKERLLKLQCEKLQIENDARRGVLVPLAEVEAATGELLAAFRTAVLNLPGRAAPKLLGMREHHVVLGILEAEVNVVIRTLRGDPAAAAAAVPAAKAKPPAAPKKRRAPAKKKRAVKRKAVKKAPKKA